MKGGRKNTERGRELIINKEGLTGRVKGKKINKYKS